MREVTWFFGVIASLCLLVGCGGPEVFHVSGTVTYDGKPLPAGMILFSPDFAKKHDGPQGSAEIKDGKYDTAQGGTAVNAGPYEVLIQGFDGVPIPEKELMIGSPLFTNFKQSVELPAADSQQNFEIKAGQD